MKGLTIKCKICKKDGNIWHDGTCQECHIMLNKVFIEMAEKGLAELKLLNEKPKGDKKTIN